MQDGKTRSVLAHPWACGRVYRTERKLSIWYHYAPKGVFSQKVGNISPVLQGLVHKLKVMDSFMFTVLVKDYLLAGMASYSSKLVRVLSSNSAVLRRTFSQHPASTLPRSHSTAMRRFSPVLPAFSPGRYESFGTKPPSKPDDDDSDDFGGFQLPPTRGITTNKTPVPEPPAPADRKSVAPVNLGQGSYATSAASSSSSPAPVDTSEEQDDEGEEREAYVNPVTGEVGGYRGPEPTTFGDWAHKGRVSDF